MHQFSCNFSEGYKSNGTVVKVVDDACLFVNVAELLIRRQCRRQKKRPRENARLIAGLTVGLWPRVSGVSLSIALKSGLGSDGS